METDKKYTFDYSVSTVNAYYQWLLDIVNVNQQEKSYWILMKVLHTKEFFWTVPNDDNRGVDGQKLREKFAEHTKLTSLGLVVSDISEGPCTMLEMLIALAMRMEYNMTNAKYRDRTTNWFWELLTNLGLDKYTDEAYVDLERTTTVDHILNRVLERTYRVSGKCGLFPLNEAKKDQRKVEIWYQMSAYLLENYYVDGKIM